MDNNIFKYSEDEFDKYFTGKLDDLWRANLPLRSPNREETHHRILARIRKHRLGQAQGEQSCIQ